LLGSAHLARHARGTQERQQRAYEIRNSLAVVGTERAVCDGLRLSTNSGDRVRQ